MKPGAYLALDREWKPGDTVQVDLDMSLHYWVGERECAGKASIYRGPLLLVHELNRQLPSPVRKPDIRFGSGWIYRDDNWRRKTKDIGGSLEADFEGTYVYWNALFSDDAGKATRNH